MKQPAKAHRTRYGEGTFTWNPNRNLWVGRYDTGQVTAEGRRIRISVSAREEDVAWQKFVAAKKKFLLEGRRLEGLRANQTVARWAEEWLKERTESVRPKTLMSDRANLSQWIIPQIGRVKLEELTAAHMRRVGEAPFSAGRSLPTANSAQRTLNKLLKDALAEGYRVPERIFAARKKSVGKSERTTMSKEEVTATFREAYATKPDAVRFFLAALYGIRQSEVLGITWDRVTIDQDALAEGAVIVGKIVIDRQLQALTKDPKTHEFIFKQGDTVIRLVEAYHLTPTKTSGGERTLPLIAPVAKELLAWKETCPQGAGNPYNLVFPRITGLPAFLGYPRNKRADLRDWKAVQQAAGVYKRQPTGEEPGAFYLLHEARHSMISMLADANVPKHIIEMLVGQTELVETYVHGSMEVAGNAINDVLAPLLPVGARD